MTVNELMNSIFQSQDLLYCGRQMIEFANVVYKEKNRATLVKNFYEKLFRSAKSYIFGFKLKNPNSRYLICDAQKTSLIYLALRIPREKTTAASINNIKGFGEYILSSFTQPVGLCISLSSLNSILDYLDEKYSFSAKVFLHSNTIFLRLPYTHKDYNSECTTSLYNSKQAPSFFLYHMRETGAENFNPDFNPESVLFHEFGHAIHAEFFGDVNNVSGEVLDLLDDIGFDISGAGNEAEHSEILADALGIGLMYQTPFEKYDVYTEMDDESKMLCKLLVEKLLGDLQPG